MRKAKDFVDKLAAQVTNMLEIAGLPPSRRREAFGKDLVTMLVKAASVPQGKFKEICDKEKKRILAKYSAPKPRRATR